MENFNVVAQWHEYVLAPEGEREKLKEHKAKIEAKTKEIGHISKTENDKLMRQARDHAGDYLLAAEDALRYERTPPRPAAARAESAGAVRAPRQLRPRGAPRWRRKSQTRPKGQGPYAGTTSLWRRRACQLDFLEETGSSRWMCT
jgi:hypothetical protein